MDDATIFYICGGALAVSAVLLSFAGLRFERFPGRAAPLVVLWFVALVGAATTFAVLNGKNEQEARASEVSKAGEEFEEEEASPVETGKAGGGGKAKPKATAKGPGGTLELAADPTQIAFDTTTLSSKPGKVTIDFTNPAALEHDVAIEQDGKQIAISPTIAKGKTSVTADLVPGTYTFLCTVPGHAEAGMEGTLTVK
jgi:plastocyanin